MLAASLGLVLSWLVCSSAIAHPGVRILEYLHAHGHAAWITLPQVRMLIFIELIAPRRSVSVLQPVKGIYLYSRYTGSADQAVISAVQQGYNTILMRWAPVVVRRL